MKPSKIATPFGIVSLAQIVTEDFYSWELRGRGWALSNSPVELEPPLRSCTYRRGLPAVIDDGRVPRLWKRVAASFAGSDNRPVPGGQSLSVAEDEPLRIAASAPLRTFLHLSLPDSVKLSKETTQRLLASVTYCSAPLAIEFVGGSGGLRCQFAVAQQDAPMIEPLLRGFMPDATVAIGADLVDAHYRTGASCAVVDFGLSDEFTVPVGVPARFDPHPLTAALAALASLPPGETGVLQVLFVPIRGAWAAEMTRAVAGPGGGGVFDDAPWMVARCQDKIAHPLFAVVMRLCARAENLDRAWGIVRNAASGLQPFVSPQGNAFIPLSNKGYPDQQHERGFLDRTSRRAGMILNSEELACLIHPPDGSLRLENVDRDTRHTRAAPSRFRTSAGLVIGTNSHRGENVTVHLSVEDRLRHMHCIGSTGSGKTTLLQRMIEQDIEAGHGVGVLDPHGDLVDGITERIPASRCGDVTLIDPSVDTGLVPLNLLAARSEGEKAVLAADLVGIFRRFATSWGDQMNAVMGNAVSAILESERGGTLLDLRRFLLDAEFRATILETVRDEETVFFWRHGFKQIGTRAIGPLLTRLDMFLRPKPVRAIVAGTPPALDVSEMLDGGILLARLAHGAIGEENAYLLGSLIAAKLNQAALQREKVEQGSRHPFFLYIDEAHQLASPSMASILSGGRKFGLGLVASHQSLDQVRNVPEVSNALIANAYTRVCFRLGEGDAERMAGGTVGFSADDFRNLRVGEAIVRVGEASSTFNVAVTPPAALDDTVAREAKLQTAQASTAKYRLPREIVVRPLPEPTIEGRERPQGPRTQRPDPTPQGFVSDEVPDRVLVRRPASGESADEQDRGKGGETHRYLQALVKRLAEEQGLKATLEAPLPGGGQVDVLIERDGIVAAVEISVTTEADYDCEKLRKCLAAGCAKVAVVVAKPKGAAARYRASLAAQLSDDERAHVSLLAPEEVPDFIVALAPPPVERETIVKGYRVRLSHGSLPPEEAKARRERLARVIAQSLAEREE